jgi:hypothetical protein
LKQKSEDILDILDILDIFLSIVYGNFKYAVSDVRESKHIEKEWLKKLLSPS